MAKSKINFEEFGPITSFSTSIISGLLVGLLIQYFLGYEPIPVVIFVLIGIYDGYRKMWKLSERLEENERWNWTSQKDAP